MNDIGYKNPPPKSRFKPGVSGNPKGRPKDSRKLDSILKEEFSCPVVIQEGGQKRKITKREALIKQMMNKAIGGDYKFALLMLEIIKDIERTSAKRDKPYRKPATVEEAQAAYQEMIRASDDDEW